MKATDWEFRYWAMIFGLIIGMPFWLYSIDSQNVTAALANWLAPLTHSDPALVTRVIFRLAAALGAMMSHLGGFVAVIAMGVFCYRLILREESELGTAQGAPYETFREAVPRLLPSPRTQIPSAGGRAIWTDGFRAEAWYWGFALSLGVFTATLEIKPFLIVLGVSIALFWVHSAKHKTG